MIDPVSLEIARKHVNLDEDDTSDDTLLGIFIAAARQACVSTTGISLSDDADPGRVALIAQAMLMLIGHWYANREAVTGDTRSIPTTLQLSVDWLLGLARNRSI